MTRSRHLLVTGATGQQGGAVTRQALRRGHHVRLLVRDPAAPAARALADLGAELCVGDLDDPDSLRAASRGVEGVFVVLVAAGGAPSERLQGERAFAATREAGVGHIVYTSAASADRDVGVPGFAVKRQLEAALLAGGVPATVVAPVYFMENNLSPFALAGLKEGRVARFLPVDHPLQQVAVDDIGRLVVAVFESGPRFQGRRLEIAGDSLTTRELARLLAARLGRPLEPVQIALQALPRGSPAADNLAAMLAWLGRAGFRADLGLLRAEFPDVPLTSFASWVNAQDWGSLPPPPCCSTADAL